MKKLIQISIILLMSCTLFAQNEKALSVLLKNTNIGWLLDFSDSTGRVYQVEHQEAVELARQNGWFTSSETAAGNYVELQQIINDRPNYYITNNLNAAKTVSTNNVWSGGSAGLSLDGSGVFMAEWDAGIALPTHQEYSSRLINKEASPTVHYHSTHVAGTIIASGVSPNAKGMAYNGSLDSYDWNNDFSEMSSSAAAGLLLSNHSYGSIRGWYYNLFSDNRWAWFGDLSISQTEDYLFGFYSSQAQTWDVIARNAPYYLIVKSAGNDRNDDGPVSGQHWVWDNGWTLSSTSRDPDGQYDCIGEKGSAKNILTIGAVDDIPGGYTSPTDVVMSSFSSWGPADDGRVKPDIVANGVSLYSTYDQSNSSYATLSGTSMATPSATGSLALLQQYYSNVTQSSYMRAATVKALVIHTADEAGPNPGPDYMFGWGLLNTEKAAEIITKDQLDANVIQEIDLANQAVYSIPFTHYGTESISATIAWTDVAGPVISPSLNPRTPALVNDLDLRITRLSDNTVFYPWKLNPDNPSAAATQGDNLVDNVEKIFIESSPAGNYLLEVSHKGTLSNGSQYFALIFEGIESLSQSVSVDSLWNLVSVPLQSSDMSFSTLFPDATTSAFAFGSSGYVQSDSAAIGKGYWLKFDQPQNYLMQGSKLADPVQVDSGWNIIGPFDEEVAVSQIVSNPSGIISSNYFGYENAYVIANSLMPGNAYWVKVDQSGQLNLTGTNKLNAPVNNVLSYSGKLIITDNTGRTAELMIIDEDQNSDLFDLPPKPPAEIYDVRFTSNRIAEPLEKEKKNIVISGAEYPVRFKTDGISLRIKDAITGSIFNERVTSGEEIVLNEKGLNLLSLEIDQSSATPESYSLQQNYPNPFNPTTVLNFSIPEAGFVELKIFNSLGESVATLVSQNKDAGSYQVEWNGTNQYGRKVVSGVYFYSITAGDFHSVKKMMLLK